MRSRYPTVVSISEDELDLAALLSHITLPSTGAVVIFSGIVRGFTGAKNAIQTVYLEYQVYRTMAEKKMLQIAREIRKQWPEVEGIVIAQRVGRLYPGAPSVFIACAAAHRESGVFEAARYGIDRLKKIVPIWKKETGSLGEVWVEGDYTPKPGE